MTLLYSQNKQSSLKLAQGGDLRNECLQSSFLNIAAHSVCCHQVAGVCHGHVVQAMKYRTSKSWLGVA